MSAINPPAYIQASSHPADSFRRAIQACLRGGYGVETLATDLVVSANGTPNMSVNVAAGRAVIPGTQNTLLQAVYEVLNDAVVNLSIGTAHASLPRNDLVVASVQDAAYSGGTNLWLLQIVPGTAAASPADPTVPANSITLARVRVDAAVTSIVSGKITDLRPSLAGTAQLLGQFVGAGGSNGGLGLFSSTSRFLGQLTVAGAPTSGTYLAGDHGFDVNGIHWLCTAGGPPGTWRAITSSLVWDTQSPTGVSAVTIPASGSFPTSGFFGIEIDCYVRAATAATVEDLLLRFNADAANNYYWAHGFENNATPQSSTVQNSGYIDVAQYPAASASSNCPGWVRIFIPGYSSTSFHKTVEARGGGIDSSSAYIQKRVTGLWTPASPAAITTLSLTAQNGGNFVTGSRFVTRLVAG